jgi:DNA polymerase III alpha subunit
MKITQQQITEIKGEQHFGTLKVKRMAKDVYRVFGYEYGKLQMLHTGFAEDTARFVNSYLG